MTILDGVLWHSMHYFQLHELVELMNTDITEYYVTMLFSLIQYLIINYEIIISWINNSTTTTVMVYIFTT